MGSTPSSTSIGSAEARSAPDNQGDALAAESRVVEAAASGGSLAEAREPSFIVRLRAAVAALGGADAAWITGQHRG